MPLAFSHRTRRLLALALACWLVWSALLPALLGASAPADSAQTGGARMLLCTPQGMSWVQVGADSSDPTPFGSDEATSARQSCPLCALAQLLPPAAGGALALAWPPQPGRELPPALEPPLRLAAAHGRTLSARGPPARRA